jgi:hypothetical protein
MQQLRFGGPIVPNPSLPQDVEMGGNFQVVNPVFPAVAAVAVPMQNSMPSATVVGAYDKSASAPAFKSEL